MYVGVEQVLVQQRVAERRQPGENSRQLQVQLVRLQTHDIIVITCTGEPGEPRRAQVCVCVPAPGGVPDGQRELLAGHLQRRRRSLYLTTGKGGEE